MSTRGKIISIVLVGGIILLLGGGYIALQCGATEKKAEKKVSETPKVSTEKEDKKLYDYAMKLDQQKDYKNAYQKFQEMVKKYPQSDFCLVALGMIWRYHAEKKIEAKEGPLLSKRLETEEERPARLMIEAEIKYSTAKSMADLKEAVRMWQQIIDKYPESKFVDEAQFHIAGFYEYIRDYKRAIKEVQKVIDKYPDSNSASTAYRLMAICYCFQKDYDKAIATLKEGLERYPDSFSAPHNQEQLAAIYSFYLKNYPQAIIEYQKVIDNYPDYEDRENIKEYIERCQLLQELQKKGVKVDKYRSESPETLREILKKIEESGK